jgi:hypothetical protein
MHPERQKDLKDPQLAMSFLDMEILMRKQLCFSAAATFTGSLRVEIYLTYAHLQKTLRDSDPLLQGFASS